MASVRLNPTVRRSFLGRGSSIFSGSHVTQLGLRCSRRPRADVDLVIRGPHLDSYSCLLTAGRMMIPAGLGEHASREPDDGARPTLARAEIIPFRTDAGTTRAGRGRGPARRPRPGGACQAF